MWKEDPRSSQGDNEPIKEVGPDQINAFERKAIELSKNAREERLGPDILTSQYIQGGISIWIDIPKPGVDSVMSDQIAVTLNKLFIIEGNSNYFFRSKKFTLNHRTKSMEYIEKITEVDSAGRRIKSFMEQKELEALVNGDLGPMIKRIEIERALGGFIVTQDNVKELMVILNSLGPDDEVF